MNYGRFFEFDFESSRLQEGVAVFNYRWLKDEDWSADTPKFPIYLTFTSEAIVFNLHYLEPESIDKKTGKTKKERHYHNPIIELFLSPNLEIMDGLSETLNETYMGEFPVRINKYLKKKIKKSFERDEKENNYLSLDNYSTLEIFDLESPNNYDENSPNPAHFLRKLVLDFIYDFEFTSVFKNLPYYNEVSIKLRENFLFNALVNKTRYYYYRMRLIGSELVSLLNEHEDDKDNAILDKKLQFLFQRYEAAEQDWVTSITDDRAMDAFHESPWFNECHEELEQVYSAEKMRNLAKKRQSNEQSLSAKRRTHAVSPVPDVPDIPNVPPVTSGTAKRVRFLHNAGITPESSFGLTVSNLLNLIHKRQSKECKKKEADKLDRFGKAVRSHNDTARVAAKWDVDHYQFPSLLRVWCGDRKTIFITSIALVVIVSLLIILFFWIHRQDQKGPLHWYNNVMWQFLIIAITGVLLLGLLFAIMRRWRRSTWGLGFPSLLMPRLLASIITAWFTFCLSEDIFLKLNVEHFNIPAIIIIALITGFFIGHESNTINPYDNVWHHIVAAVWVFVIAYIYAVVSGLLIYEFFGEDFLASYKIDLLLQRDDLIQLRNNELNELSDPTEVAELQKLINWKHPNKRIFVFQFSFLASFIGVFLQMMLQGVSITKSE